MLSLNRPTKLNQPTANSDLTKVYAPSWALRSQPLHATMIYSWYTWTWISWAFSLPFMRSFWGIEAPQWTWYIFLGYQILGQKVVLPQVLPRATGYVVHPFHVDVNKHHKSVKPTYVSNKSLHPSLLPTCRQPLLYSWASSPCIRSSWQQWNFEETLENNYQELPWNALRWISEDRRKRTIVRSRLRLMFPFSDHLSVFFDVDSVAPDDTYKFLCF